MSKIFDRMRSVSGWQASENLMKQKIRMRLLGISKILLLLLALISFVSLIAEYGFYIGEEMKFYTSKMPDVVLIGFTIYYAARILLEENRKKFIATHRIELFLASLILLYLLFPYLVTKIILSINPLLKPETLTYVYLIVSQILAAVALSVEAINQTKKILYLNVQPSLLLMLSFLFIIAVGTILLMLPKATVSGNIKFIDALFTSTSAVTVTGLTVVNTQTFFTTTGKVIIMVLIQLGGLGIMTLTSFFALTSGKSYNLKEYITIQEILGEENIAGVKKFIYHVVATTFSIEIIGTVLIYYLGGINFIGNSAEKLFFAAFHSVSAFCNAGFSLFGDNLMNKNLVLNFPFLIFISSLIIAGGIGFPVMRDLGNFVSAKVRKKKFKLKLHTKIVLIITFLLLTVGTIFFYLIESGNTMSNQTGFQKILTSFFQSVTTRTAGFNSVDIGKLVLPASFLFIVLMWIGASPASTGGGIKTTTFGLSLLNLFSIATGKNKVEIFKKKISESDINKAFSTIILSMIYITIAVFLLSLTEKFSFEDILFEVISASSTVGLSKGITAELSNWGKLIIISAMFVGRIGFLTFTLVLFRRREISSYDYVEERVIL
jgi:potassium uptake TrkH family protein